MKLSKTSPWQKIITDYPPVPEKDQIPMIMSGDKEKIDRVALGYIRRIYKIVCRYTQNPQELDDYIQEGYTGLMRGIEKFNPDKGVKLITYVDWWIRERIRKLRYNNRLMRIPAQTWGLIYRFKKLEEEMTDKNGIEPTFEEVAKEMGLKPKKAARLWKAIQQPFSLHSLQYDENGEATELDFPGKQNLEKDVQINEEVIILTDRIKNRLTTEEKIILKMKLEHHSKKEIAETIKQSPQYVTKVENRILDLLK